MTLAQARGVPCANHNFTTDINVADAEAVAADVAAMGRASLGTAVDVTDQGSVEEMVRQVTDRPGPIDIPVTHPGTIGPPGRARGAQGGAASTS